MHKRLKCVHLSRSWRSRREIGRRRAQRCDSGTRGMDGDGSGNWKWIHLSSQADSLHGTQDAASSFMILMDGSDSLSQTISRLNSRNHAGCCWMNDFSEGPRGKSRWMNDFSDGPRWTRLTVISADSGRCGD
jgi:hypothetical protein